MEASWAPLGASWGVFGPSWGHLGASWGVLAASWRVLEIKSRLGSVLEASWALKSLQDKSASLRSDRGAARFPPWTPTYIDRRAFGETVRATSASRHPPASVGTKMASPSPFQTYPLITSLSASRETVPRGALPVIRRPRRVRGGFLFQCHFNIFASPFTLSFASW